MGSDHEKQKGRDVYRAKEYADFYRAVPNHTHQNEASNAPAFCRCRQNNFDQAAPLLVGIVRNVKFEKRANAIAVAENCTLWAS